jgi:hypothetical protein
MNMNLVRYANVCFDIGAVDVAERMLNRATLGGEYDKAIDTMLDAARMTELTLAKITPISKEYFK